MQEIRILDTISDKKDHFEARMNRFGPCSMYLYGSVIMVLFRQAKKLVNKNQLQITN